MSFCLKRILSFSVILGLSFSVGCNSVEKEDEDTIEVITDEIPETDDMSIDREEEFPIDALDVDISTLVGTWERTDNILGGIKPPRIKTSDYKLKIYSWGDNYYVDYSYRVEERIKLDENRKSRRSVKKVSDVIYKKIPFKKEKVFFTFTVPDKNLKLNLLLYFIAKRHEGKIVLEETDPVPTSFQSPFKSYFVKQESKKTD